MTAPRSKFAPIDEALVGEKWDRADSLGSRLFADESEDPSLRWQAGVDAAAAKAARGAIARARADLDRVIALAADSPDQKRYTLTVESLMDLLGSNFRSPARAVAPGDSSEVWRGYLAFAWAVAGDTARSRALIVRLRSHAPRWEARLLTGVAEGVIHSRAGRNERVVELLGPTARSRLFESRLPRAGTAYAIRWLVGNAWERLGRQDSAAVDYELAQEIGRADDVDFNARAVTLPYALQRLVVVNARMGRFAEAERRWQDLQRLVTRPDDEFRPLIAEARVELAKAKAREGPAGR